MRTKIGRWVSAVAGVLVGALTAAPTFAQFDNPVYVDDSPNARDTFARLDGVLARENYTEAVRVLQRLLDLEGERLIESGDDADLYYSVRHGVHARLLASDELLGRYREIVGPTAAAALEAGDADRAERTALLTPAGFDAALILAEERLHRGVFESARLVLEPLIDHPDFAGDRADRAAALAGRVAAYLDRPAAWAWADAWAARANQPAPGRVPIPWPERLLQTAADPAAPLASFNTEGLVSTPLRSAPLRPAGAPRESTERRQRQRLGQPQRVQPEPIPWTLPFALGDAIFTNEGRFITAWDRFSLSMLWRIDLPGESGERGTDNQRRDGRAATVRTLLGRSIEDVGAFSWAYPYLLTVTGIADQGGRDGDGRVHAIDPETGDIAWSTSVAGGLDAQLDFASARGTPVSDGATVVLGARKYIPSQRTSTAYLVGLDLFTGEARWLRLIASVGALPHRSRALVAASSTLHQGVIYRADELGVLAAVEADTGRLRWLRRGEGPTGNRNMVQSPWAGRAPLVDGDSLVVLETNQTKIDRVALETGRLLASRATAAFGDVHTLARVGRWLLAVGREQVTAVPIEAFEREPTRPRTLGRPDGFVGRPVVVGDRLLVPVSTGAILFDPERPDEVERVELESSGHVLPLESQLLVADGSSLHSYLVWNVARDLLTQRIQANPADPEPARSFAELAYRAARPDEIVPAVDLALEALAERPPEGERDGQDRARLFHSVRVMVLAAQHSSGEITPAAEALMEAPETVDALIDRLQLAAGSPSDHVVYLMARGSFEDAAGRPEASARAYQSVLDDAALARAVWAGPGLTVRAEFEARRRLRALIEDHGPRLYAVFDEEARLRLPGLITRGDAESLVALAKRYPAGEVAAEAWLAAAEAIAGDAGPEQDPESADAARRQRVDALRSGLVSVERHAGAGGRPSPGVLAAITGGLVLDLSAMGEVARARAALDRARAIDPNVQPARLGVDELGMRTVIAASALDEALSASPRAVMPLPSVGGVPDASGIRPLAGWRAIVPTGTAPGPAWPDRVLMRSTDGSGLALFAVPEDGGPLAPVWEREAGATQHELAWWDEQSAWLVTRPATIAASGRRVGGWSVERLDLATGATRWRVGPFEGFFDGVTAEMLPDASAGAASIEVPGEGRVAMGDVLITGDGRTLALVERSGRCAALDLLTGELLWAWRGPVRRVYDAEMVDGRLAIGGIYLPERGLRAVGPAPEELAAQPGPLLVVYDARTGEEAFRPDRLGSAPVWLRAHDRTLLVGLEDRIVSVDLAAGRENWVNEDNRIVGAERAWLAGGRLYVTVGNRRLSWIDADSGQMNGPAIETQGRLSPAPTLRILDAGEGRALLASGAGFVAIDREGRGAAADAIGASGELSAPVFAIGPRGDRWVFAVATDAESTFEGAGTFGFFAVDAESMALRIAERVSIPESPVGVFMLNGRALLDTRRGAIEIPLPASSR
ncbi:MAG: PQQ-binding-like beta-propeller repeat protein [Planctomycetota bacterium]